MEVTHWKPAARCLPALIFAVVTGCSPSDGAVRSLPTALRSDAREREGDGSLVPRDLGSFGGVGARLFAINDKGQGAGLVVLASGDIHALFRDATGIATDLGTMGGTISTARGMNQRGVVVGGTRDASDVEHPFLWTTETGVVDLGSLGGVRGRAQSVNRSGHVVGFSFTAQGARHPFYWSRERGMVDLLGDPGARGIANAINDDDEVVGSVRFSDRVSHAFRWTPRTGFTDLGTLGFDSASANAISGEGVIVGDVVTGGHGLAFRLSREGELAVLSLPAGFANASPTSINDRGDIVGIGYDDPFNVLEAEIWRRDGRVTRLPWNGPISLATWITERGTVAGEAVTPSFGDHAVIWTPVNR